MPRCRSAASPRTARRRPAPRARERRPRAHGAIASAAALRRDAASLSILVASSSTGRPLAEIARQQRHVRRRKPVPRINDEHEPDERLARRDVAPEECLPVALERLWHGRVAVARKVGEQRARPQSEVVDLLRAARRPAREREPRLPASALIALDLPAFERPANAISGAPGGGNCASFGDALHELRLLQGMLQCASSGGVRERCALGRDGADPLQYDVLCRWTGAASGRAATRPPALSEGSRPR